MKIEVINTGSELLLGTTVNTHAATIGSALLKVGLRIQRQTTVPDGQAILDALQESIFRSDAVILTGGIGPTSDDISREALAEVLNLPLVEDPQALQAIQAYFDQHGRPMATDNRKQALKPRGAEILPNPHGTAPGIHTPPSLNPDSPCAVFLLPGPPGEMQPMLVDEVIPRLRQQYKGASPPPMQIMRFSGIGESDFHAELDRPFSNIPDLEIGYCARPGELDLRLIGSPESIQQARQLAQQTFPHKCFSSSEQQLEETVVEQLSRQKLRLTLAESCTGGRIANRITDVAGASSVFTHGYVTYSNTAKQQMLGVDPDLIEQYGAVSEQVAIAMADGARSHAGADLAAAVTGIAGPGGGSDAKPVGTVWLAISTAEHSLATHAYYPRGRERFKQLVSQKALDLIRLELIPDHA